MDDVRLGVAVRVIRARCGWRQEDLATAAGVPRDDVLRIEAGRARDVRFGRVRAVFEALGGWIDLVPHVPGADLARTLNAGHATMHEAVARILQSAGGWEIAPEVSFSIYGERGVIDILAWHAASRTLLIIELKTEIVDINELMGKADQRRRLAPVIAADRGWHPAVVAVWVAVADTRTNRRRLAAHRTILRAAFPVDGRSVEPWLRRPAGSLAALSFLTSRHGVRAGTKLSRRRRVYRARPRTILSRGS